MKQPIIDGLKKLDALTVSKNYGIVKSTNLIICQMLDLNQKVQYIVFMAKQILPILEKKNLEYWWVYEISRASKNCLSIATREKIHAKSVIDDIDIRYTLTHRAACALINTASLIAAEIDIESNYNNYEVKDAADDSKYAARCLTAESISDTIYTVTDAIAEAAATAARKAAYSAYMIANKTCFTGVSTEATQAVYSASCAICAATDARINALVKILNYGRFLLV